MGKTVSSESEWRAVGVVFLGRRYVLARKQIRGVGRSADESAGKQHRGGLGVGRYSGGQASSFRTVQTDPVFRTQNSYFLPPTL